MEIRFMKDYNIKKWSILNKLDIFNMVFKIISLVIRRLQKYARI